MIPISLSFLCNVLHGFFFNTSEAQRLQQEADAIPEDQDFTVRR
jgi:hypothetical protein